MPRVVVVKVGGETHTADLDDLLRIHNADAERHTVAADMAWWGTIAAAAEAQVQRLTAVAASWFADALVKCLKIDEKMSEWKAKANAGAHPEYQKLQSDIANAQEMAGRANTVHWALVRKMDMLREMIRGEAGDRRGSFDIGRGITEGVALPPEEDPRIKKFKDKRGTKPQTVEG
jgi:hypothetical protein